MYILYWVVLEGSTPPPQNRLHGKWRHSGQVSEAIEC
jgi:hypothetical protein